jgi:hypothetical protein
MMESMNGQSILNGQGHLKSNYIHEDRSMKNGSTGSNSSTYRFLSFVNSIQFNFVSSFKTEKKGSWKAKKEGSFLDCEMKEQFQEKKVWLSSNLLQAWISSTTLIWKQPIVTRLWAKIMQNYVNIPRYSAQSVNANKI